MQLKGEKSKLKLCLVNPEQGVLHNNKLEEKSKFSVGVSIIEDAFVFLLGMAVKQLNIK